jgi:hypothetical protein
MEVSIKYKSLSVNKNSLVLTMEDNVKVSVLFTEVESLEPVKLMWPVIYEGFLVLFMVLYTLVSIAYLLSSKLLLIPVALVLYFYIKIKNMKKFGVLVRLKDGGVYEI